MTVAIIDKYPMLRLGLIKFLKEYFQRLTIFELDNFEIRDSIAPLKDVDLIILAIGQASHGDSTVLIENVKKRYPMSKLVAYDEKTQPVLITHYLRAGLQGYISKQEDPQKLLDCINQVMNDQKYISEQTINLTLDRYGESGIGRARLPLSAREIQVATFLCKGMSTSEIAEALDKKMSTISTIKFYIFQKMGVDNVIKLREQFSLGNSKLRK